MNVGMKWKGGLGRAESSSLDPRQIEQHGEHGEHRELPGKVALLLQAQRLPSLLTLFRSR